MTSTITARPGRRPDDPPEVREKLNRRRHPSRRHPIRYFIPVLIVLAVVYLYPLVYLVWLVFQKTKFFAVTGSAGFENIVKLFTDDRLVTNLFNSLRFAAGSLVIALPAGLGAAVLLQRVTRMKRFARTMLLLPWLLSQATVGTMWLWFLNPQFGPASHAVQQVGMDRLVIFSNPNLAWIALIVITAWWSYPQAMLFFLGALQSIPEELRESIKMDGGGVWASFRHVTVPYVRNTAVTVAVILIMLYLHMVTLILVTTGGGPIITTETVSLRIYNQLFSDFNLSGAAASALLLFAVNIVLTLVVIKLRRREEIF